jgi:hypothetical protein
MKRGGRLVLRWDVAHGRLVRTIIMLRFPSSLPPFPQSLELQDPFLIIILAMHIITLLTLHVRRVRESRILVIGPGSKIIF